MTALFNKKNISPTKKAKPKAGVSGEETKKIGMAAPISVSTTFATPERESNIAQAGGLDLAMVLIRPHVTEKATDLSGRGVHVFEINKFANKMHVRQAIEKLYKVRPVKIAVVHGKPKFMKNPRTGRVQTKKTGTKKALVYLKSGDTIEFV